MYVEKLFWKNFKKNLEKKKNYYIFVPEIKSFNF